MQLHQYLLYKKITKIQRIDYQSDYDLNTTNAIILTLDGLESKLVLSVVNDGISCDIQLMSGLDIENVFGSQEQILNDLKQEDELNYFLNDLIKGLKIAEFLQSEIKGEDFIIKQDKYAGVKIETTNHSILFHNNHGGWIDIDDEVVELPNQGRWRWIN